MLIDMNNPSVVGGFNRGRARNRETHALLVQLFELQVEYYFMLSLKWIPTAEHGVADAISRPSREAIISIAPAAFKVLRVEMSPFNVDLMACTASVVRSPSNKGCTSLLLSVRLRWFRRDRRVCARCFYRARYERLGFRILFPTPYQGRTHCPTHGGMRGSRCCPLARCEGVLIPLVAVRHGEIYRGGPGGGEWVLSVAQRG